MGHLLQTATNSTTDGLTKLFSEIREKKCVEELSPQFQKFAEWLRIEYVQFTQHHVLGTNPCLGLLRRFTICS